MMLHERLWQQFQVTPEDLEIVVVDSVVLTNCTNSDLVR